MRDVLPSAASYYQDYQPFSVKNTEIQDQSDRINVFSLISIAILVKFP